MRIAAATVLLAVLVAGPALAQTKPAAKAKAATAAPAHHLPLQAAAQGDPQAQYEMGHAYLTGTGVKRNPTDAIAWLAAAAGNGHVAAAQSLARAYEQGDGVAKDLGQASQWWYRAGDLGDDVARRRFVDLYLAGRSDGIGGPAAVRWLETLAGEGDPAVLLAVGDLYESGQGVLVDRAKARHWYTEAALAGNAEAKFRLGHMLLAEPAQWRLLFKDVAREKDNAERDRLYPTRAAALQAAGDERRPDIMRPGMIEAEEWLVEAARQGHAEAAHALGMAHLTGLDLPLDLGQAIGWLSAAAWGGHAGAMLVLADLAAKGHGFPNPDPVRAWVNYDIAAAQGLKQAEDARDRLGKGMNSRQLGRARQVAAELKGN
jgi:TPR repeat protein